MPNFETCAWRTAAQRQNPLFPASKHVFFLGFCYRARFFPRILLSRTGATVFQVIQMAKSGKKTSFDVGKIGFCRCAAVLPTQVPKLCSALDLSLFYILILGTYSKFARENNFLALGVGFPQPCSSAGRRFAASRSRL